MGKGLLLGLAAGAALLLSARPLDAQVPYHAGLPAYSAFLLAAARALLPAIGQLERIWPAFLFNPHPKAQDGGGDGGGSGGGDGGGSGDGSGSGGDSTGGDTSATGATSDPGAASDPGAVDNTDAVAPTTDPTADLTAVPTALTPELDAIMSIPTTDPRGGEVSAPTTTGGTTIGVPTGPTGPGPTLPTGTAPGPAPPGGPGPPGGGVDVPINAIIVSGASSALNAIGKVPGVRNVIITGGVIALGRTPLPGEGPSPFRLIPDLRMLNGSVFPPVVPNVIDVRIMSNTIQAVENPPN
jgi:hypothetical protein